MLIRLMSHYKIEWTLDITSIFLFKMYKSVKFNNGRQIVVKKSSLMFHTCNIELCAQSKQCAFPLLDAQELFASLLQSKMCNYMLQSIFQNSFMFVMISFSDYAKSTGGASHLG